MTALGMRERQELVQGQSVGIVSGRFGPSRSVPHYAFLQRPRHLAVLLVVGVYVSLGETMRPQEVRVILLPGYLACRQNEMKRSLDDRTTFNSLADRPPFGNGNSFRLSFIRIPVIFDNVRRDGNFIDSKSRTFVLFVVDPPWA